MTAYAMETDKRRVLEAGMNDHIAKPIDPEVLFATLERFVSVREPGDSHGSLGTREGFPQENQDSLVASLPHLSTIDFRDGLARVGGKTGFVLELLARFREDHRDVGDRIAAALEGGDADTNAAVAAALLGAKFGAEGIPKKLLSSLHNGSTLDIRIDRLCSLHET